jgi:hypothetical protein
MKKITNLICFMALLSLIACKTTKTVTYTEVITEVEEVVTEAVIAEDAVIAMDVMASPSAFSVITYYTIEKQGQREVWVEKSVVGTSEISMASGKERLIITPEGSDETIICKKQTHPDLNMDVYLEIGGDSDERAH